MSIVGASRLSSHISHLPGSSWICLTGTTAWQWQPRNLPLACCAQTFLILKALVQLYDSILEHYGKVQVLILCYLQIHRIPLERGPSKT